MTRYFLLLVSALLLAGTATEATASSSIEGRWLTANGEGWIDIRIEGGTPAGYIAGSPQDPDRLNPPRLDELNPDPALRDRQLYGLQIIRDMTEDGTNKWKGLVYDPDTGNTYKCTLTLVDDNTLKLRGFIGISLFGRTETWTRVL